MTLALLFSAHVPVPKLFLSSGPPENQHPVITAVPMLHHLMTFSFPPRYLLRPFSVLSMAPPPDSDAHGRLNLVDPAQYMLVDN